MLYNKKAVPKGTAFCMNISKNYFFFAVAFAVFLGAGFVDFCLITAWAAARRAIGTRKGEQLT